MDNVQLAQLAAEAEILRMALAAAIDLQLLDEIHLDTASLKILGRRLANLVYSDLYQALPIESNLVPDRFRLEWKELRKIVSR